MPIVVRPTNRVVVVRPVVRKLVIARPPAPGMLAWLKDVNLTGATPHNVLALGSDGKWAPVVVPSLLFPVRVVIPHGSNPNFPRPAGIEYGEWLGTVEPLNSLDLDTWIVTA